MPSLPPLPPLPPLTYDELLIRSRLPRLEARALMEHTSGKRREWLIAHGDESPEVRIAIEFDAFCGRRQSGSPIAYLVGWREFFGRRFKVCPDVLIPRPETELLVEQALQRAPANATVIDLGTGSGSIAVSLACERTDLDILATDRSGAALTIARENALGLCPEAVHGHRLRFLRSDWWEQVPAETRFDLIVSNPPYIEPGDHHLEQGDLRFEPRMALTDETDGLQAFRDIVSCTANRLTQGGYLLLEHGSTQAGALTQLLQDFGFKKVETHFDGAGLGRVTMAKLTDAVHTF